MTMTVALYTHEEGIVQWFRFTQYVELWRRMGISVRFVRGLGFRRGGRGFRVNRSNFAGADVVVFCRLYYTADGRDMVTDSVLPWIARQGCGILWDTDDDLFDVPPWNGYQEDHTANVAQITALARAADLVTCSTPHLRGIYRQLNPNVTVVRNAVDLAAYANPFPEVIEHDPPRLLYYGVGGRMLDMMGGRVAAEAAHAAATWAVTNKPEWAREAAEGAATSRQWYEAGGTGNGYAGQALLDLRGRTTNVFLGNPITISWTQYLWDEVRKAVPVEQWAAYLAAAQGDIGVAPLTDHPWDRGKSELHWLEYGAAGVASVLARLKWPGPYDVAGDAALHARGRREWYEAIERLIESPGLRAELVGRSRERIRAEYSLEQRAEEWAAAFRDAAEHPGRGDRQALIEWADGL